MDDRGYSPPDYNAEADWQATGTVICDDCGSRVRTATLASLPPHGCTPRRALRLTTDTKAAPAQGHLWPCGCLINDAGAHRVGCPEYPEGRRG